MAALGRPWPARPGRTWLIGLAVPWLVGLLLAAPAGASHPSVMPEIGPAEIDASAPDPTLADHRPPAGPWTAALVCLAVLTLPALLAARQWRHSATVATLGLLIWFSAEAAFHSAHHATEPEEADHCQVFSAAQHLPGVDPEPALPVLERPAPVAVAPLPPPAVVTTVALDGEQARAPPDRPA